MILASYDPYRIVKHNANKGTGRTAMRDPRKNVWNFAKIFVARPTSNVRLPLQLYSLLQETKKSCALRQQVRILAIVRALGKDTFMIHTHAQLMTNRDILRYSSTI